MMSVTPASGGPLAYSNKKEPPLATNTGEKNTSTPSRELNGAGEPNPATPENIAAEAPAAPEQERGGPAAAHFISNSGASTHPTG
jgi:hypothetical protein